jgi:hypothetical protein
MRDPTYANLTWQPRWNGAEAVGSLSQSGADVMATGFFGVLKFQLDDDASVAAIINHARQFADMVENAKRGFDGIPDDDGQTPFQADRDRAEETGTWPESWGPFHRHFANDAIHRDGGPECDQPGTPRRVYMFDSDILAAHEAAVARWAVAQHRQEPGLP